jgi:hypothetical protein
MKKNVAHLSNFTICYAEFRGIFTELLMAYCIDALHKAEIS